MRTRAPERLEAGRYSVAGYVTEPWTLHGAFQIWGPRGESLRIIASTGTEPGSPPWEHVSVSTQRRIPNWEEMCFVKDLFWEEEECVMQLHPPRSEYVNHHPYCLHMWRPLYTAIPQPPSFMVGPK